MFKNIKNSNFFSFQSCEEVHAEDGLHHGAFSRNQRSCLHRVLECCIGNLTFVASKSKLMDLQVTPESTQKLDFAFTFAFLNSMAQPIICICIVTQIREAFLNCVLPRFPNSFFWVTEGSQHPTRAGWIQLLYHIRVHLGNIICFGPITCFGLLHRFF